MSEMDNYYKSIIEKAKKLIDDKKYDEAIFLLEDELDAPYVPINHLTVLEELLVNANVNKNYFSGLNRVENMGRDQLLKQIFVNNSFDTSALMLFFERYNSSITNEDYLFFESIFINKEIESTNKILLFESLCFYKTNYNFKFYNKNLKELFEINPKSTLIFEQIDLYKNAKELINEMSSKEPSLLNFCYNILFMIYEYYFPSIPDFEYKTLASSIMNYMINSLQGELIEENEIVKLINKIIDKKSF